jgi:hypothetical protein
MLPRPLLLPLLAAAIPVLPLPRPPLMEPSGLAQSRRQPGVFWAVNDSGNPARVFAIAADGRLLADIPVEGAPNVDWEAVALDDRGGLWIGDFGDNKNVRTDRALLRLAEPHVSVAGDGAGGGFAADVGESAPAPLELRVPLRYADESRDPAAPPGTPSARPDFDAEALFFAGDSLWILTKHRSDTKTTLYRMPLDVAASAAASPPPPLLPLASFDTGPTGGHPYPGMVTSADASPDGRRLAVLTYHALFVFDGDPARGDWLSRAPTWRMELDAATWKQCEAVAWDGDDLLVANEQGELRRVTPPASPPVTSATPPATLRTTP